MDKLEDKTKSQLLDIIDRKDRIERELRDINITLNDRIENLKNDIVGTEKVLNKTREELNWYKEEYSKTTEIKTEYERYKNEYENICDILAVETIKHKYLKYFHIVIIAILLICLLYSIMIIYN